MLSAAVLVMSMFCALRLDTPGSFPKPLPRKEEQEYLERASKGDMEARNVLIERNLRLVAHIMKKYYTQASDQEDLISIGTIGLIKGIESFDPSKGARLATYAARCVENSICTPTRFSIPNESRSRRVHHPIGCGVCFLVWMIASRSSSFCAREQSRSRILCITAFA